MFNLKTRRPWMGSAVFVLSIAAIAFAFIYVPTATTKGVSATVRLACVALGFACHRRDSSVEAPRTAAPP